MYIKLKISKNLICHFHCDHIKEKYAHQTKLLFTEIDSSEYQIEIMFVYEDFYTNRDIFAFSEFPEYLTFHDVPNKKIIGKVNEETIGVLTVEFVVLKPEVYSLIKEILKEPKRQKELTKMLKI